MSTDSWENLFGTTFLETEALVACIHQEYGYAEKCLERVSAEDMPEVLRAARQFLALLEQKACKFDSGAMRDALGLIAEETRAA